MNETQIRKASCHCGQVQFEAEMPAELKPTRCNCSICAKKGVAMIYVPLAALRVMAGEDMLNCYQFNTRVAKHYFCSNCGIQCYHQPRSDPSKYAINAACIEGVAVYEDFARMAVNDGVHHILDNDGVRRTAGFLNFEKTES